MKVGRKIAERFASGLRYSEEGLVPVAVTGGSGLIMLAYASKEAVEKTLASGDAWFYSRSRGELWRKGDTSGNRMNVVSVGVDCDSDALQYVVRVLGKGNACHTGRRSCFETNFGDEAFSLAKLAAVIEERIKSGSRTSYTRKLLRSRKLACAKIEEESAELVEALRIKNRKEVAWEAADLIYHALVAARARGVKLEDIEKELGRRNSRNRKN